MAADDRRTIHALEPPDGEMAVGDALKMVHEDEVDGGAADGASTGSALAANRSETITPNRDAISVSKPLTTGAEARATPRSMR